MYTKQINNYLHNIISALWVWVTELKKVPLVSQPSDEWFKMQTNW
jgi:hypothetical protein